jgi:hypothetical protein
VRIGSGTGTHRPRRRGTTARSPPPPTPSSRVDIQPNREGGSPAANPIQSTPLLDWIYSIQSNLEGRRDWMWTVPALGPGSTGYKIKTRSTTRSDSIQGQCIQYLTRALALGPSSAPDLSWLAPVPFIETYHFEPHRASKMITIVSTTINTILQSPLKATSVNSQEYQDCLQYLF